jgi:hypothetical protein
MRRLTFGDRAVCRYCGQDGRALVVILAWITFGCGLLGAALAVNPSGFLLGLGVCALGLALLSG